MTGIGTSLARGAGLAGPAGQPLTVGGGRVFRYVVRGVVVVVVVVVVLVVSEVIVVLLVGRMVGTNTTPHPPTGR